MDLFRVLQKANLTSYYDAFLSSGGDDVQQLLEATEEELQEILRVVGMGNKPLHVIRLKKALADWKVNPEKFTSTTNPSGMSETAISPLNATSNMIFTVNDQMRNYVSVSAFQPGALSIAGQGNFTLPNGNLLAVQGQHQLQPNEWNGAGGVVTAGHPNAGGVLGAAGGAHSVVPRGIPVNLLNNASLTAEEKGAIEAAADDLVKAIPEYPIKEPSPSRKKEAGLFEVIKMSADNPSRASAIFRYSSIYGRFNKARKTGKPMNLHEVAVNEASSQLCLRMPSLLSRREDLYPLARQVVKIAEDAWKCSYRFKSHKKKKPNPHVVAIANEMSSYHQTNPQAGYVRVQEKIEFVKGQLCDIITQQDKLRIAFRAAKEGSAGPSMSEIQKQIDALSAIQQTRIAEQGRYVLELRRFRNEILNPGGEMKSSVSANNGGTEHSGNGGAGAASSSGGSSGPSMPLVATSNSNKIQQQQQSSQQHFLSSSDAQHLLSSNMFTVFPTGTGLNQQQQQQQVQAQQQQSQQQLRSHPATFLLGNNPMAAVTAVSNSNSSAGSLNLVSGNNSNSSQQQQQQQQPTTAAYNSQMPSFSVFTSFGQMKSQQQSANSGTGGNDMKMEESSTASGGQVHAQYNLMNMN